ncbi:hypothetical protein [uncultured Bifidobacterium sp.]|uniref:hypothetical protein n=1 Tax=uncultured Bifidobacterium sp. TaxID=165187 RepID=UPI00260EB66C|nr:hypothetical protein [uncultured Bifidobacterium sp.]
MMMDTSIGSIGRVDSVDTHGGHPGEDDDQRYDALQNRLISGVTRYMPSIREDCLRSLMAGSAFRDFDRKETTRISSSLEAVVSLNDLWDWLCDVNAVRDMDVPRIRTYWFLVGYVREGGRAIERHVDEFQGVLLDIHEVALVGSGEWRVDEWGKIRAVAARPTTGAGSGSWRRW